MSINNLHIASPLTGWYADRSGTEWVTFLCLLLAVPWWVVMTLQSSLPLFLVAFVIESTFRQSPRLYMLTSQPAVALFTSGVVSPLAAELAAVSRNIKGVGCEWFSGEILHRLLVLRCTRLWCF